MRQVVALLALMTVAGTGCTASPPPSHPTPARHTPSPALQGYVRPCASSVWGELGPVTPRTDAIADPIAFIGLNGDSQLAPKQLHAHGGKYNAVKVLAVVKAGWQVTVTVPGSDRGSAALLYNPDAFSLGPPYPFSAGDPVVTFPNCGGTQSSWDAGTQFNGGLLVRRPMCVHLDITAVRGPARLTRQIAAPLGRGASCP
jgi:hypothetical protein